MQFIIMKYLTLLLLLASCASLPTVGEIQTMKPGEEALLPLPEWAFTGALYEINLRNFTPEGTLKAAIGHLPRLQQLGVRTLWLHPFQPQSQLLRKGTHGSPFSQRNLRGVDEVYGTVQDLKAFVDQVHRLNMKVILDVVLNHTGWDHPWIQEHPEWYKKDKEGKIIPPTPHWADVAQLDHTQPDLQQELFETLKWWVVEQDFDGFRLDAAGGLPQDFWNWALPQVYALKPLLILAEWGEEEPPFASFNLVYFWSQTLDHLWRGSGPINEVYDLQKYNLISSEGVPHLQFLTNHFDMSRRTPLEVFHGIPGSMAAVVLFFSLPGLPYVYSGQEVGSTQTADTVNRDVITGWDENPELQAFYAQYLNLWASTKALQQGALHPWIHDSYPRVAAFSRIWQDQKVLVLVNASDVAVRYPLPLLKDKTQLVDLWTGQQELAPSAVDLGPWGWRIFQYDF